MTDETKTSLEYDELREASAKMYYSMLIFKRSAFHQKYEDAEQSLLELETDLKKLKNKYAFYKSSLVMM